ncbi:MAG: outer membrane lipoprotein-sorting protein [Spirochaetes bacterium]|nr:outer membrane lipoprotein-sorting protein [Spirochaetota bacterium]
MLINIGKYTIMIASLLFAVMSNAVPEEKISAYEIIEKSDKAMRGDTQQAIMEITVKTRRWTRTMKLKSFEISSRRKSFAEIYAPQKDAGNRFLLIGKNMWQYVPKLQQTIKISPSMMLQSWMGSDFSNDDIVKESSIKIDYTHKIIGMETINNQKCYKIELTPKPDAAVVWGKIIYYARESDYLPLLEEFYNEHGVKKKVLTLSQFKTMHDRVIPTLYKMQSVNKDDQFTIMKIKDAVYNKPIPDKIFTLQNLQRK